MRRFRFSLLSICFIGIISSSLWGDPDPESFAKQMKEFETQRLETYVPENAVVCVGSSTMRMWANRIKSDLEPPYEK